MNNNKGMILPNKDGDFKIVQLLCESQLFLLTGSLDSEHFIILREFLQEKKLVFNVTRIGYYDVPILDGQHYKVLGMGQLLTDLDYKKAIFSGKSGRYDIGLDGEFIETVRRANPDWTIILF